MVLSRRLSIVLKRLTILLSVTLVLGVTYEQLGRMRDRRALPQIGRSVDIGGRTLNIFCSGTGGPAVIFESGGDGPGLGWEAVQTEVAKFTEACWYDRAGIGWSDPGPYPRTSAAIARDLHALLQHAGVPAPYVLVGASFGGLNCRVYADLFPNEVAGMVLVDSAHEDEPQRAPKFYLGHTAPRFLWHPMALTLRMASVIGLIRLTESSAAQGKHPNEMTREEIIAALRQRPKSVANNISTGVVLPESYEEARRARGIGDRPLIVLAAGRPMDFGDPELNRQTAAYQQVWVHEMQAGLASLSTRGREIVVENSNHTNIPPDVTVNAVREIVADERAEGPPPAK
jgi:pimeloyl-ACP methyl ester carboxylesterase